MLNEGDKVLVAHRRLFPRDAARFFIGRVDACAAGLLKVTGHSFARNVTTGNLVEKTESRTKVLSLSSGTLIVYQLPGETVMETITFDWGETGLTITDGRQFTMNLSEYTHATRE